MLESTFLNIFETGYANESQNMQGSWNDAYLNSSQALSGDF